jgi:hypothetical protein
MVGIKDRPVFFRQRINGAGCAVSLNRAGAAQKNAALRLCRSYI